MRELMQLPTSLICEIIDCSAMRPVGLKETFLISNVLQLPHGTIPMRASIIGIHRTLVNIFARSAQLFARGLSGTLTPLRGPAAGPSRKIFRK